MTCRDCVYNKMCSKAKHIENYHLKGECSDFKNKDDFVEIVRCKDCKYLEIDDGWTSGRACLMRGGNTGWCHDDDFCSYGKRKV